jgi:tetratricopeptide (TPR) repeat protein
MSKSIFSATVAVVALAFAGLPALMHAAEISPASAAALVPVQEAVKAKRWAEVIDKANAALKIPEKTPYDEYVVYTWLAAAYQAQGNRAELLRALQKQLDTGIPQPAEQNKTIKIMAVLAHQGKDFLQSQELGNRLIRGGAADADTYDMVGDSLSQQGKHADASKFLGDYVAEQERQGKKPSEQLLVRLLALYRKQGNSAGVATIQEKLVIHYRKPEYWEALLYQLSHDPKLTEAQTMQIYRLKVATQTLKRCEDITEMADMAINAGVPGEGLRLIEQAIAGKSCAEKTAQDKLVRMQATATREVAADKARLAKLEADGRASKTGELDVEFGATQFGYGEFGKAIEAFTRGIGKGGLKNPADAQLFLGIAQLRASNKGEALKAFQSIKTADPLMQRLVRLWVLYAQ